MIRFIDRAGKSFTNPPRTSLTKTILEVNPRIGEKVTLCWYATKDATPTYVKFTVVDVNHEEAAEFLYFSKSLTLQPTTEEDERSVLTLWNQNEIPMPA